MLTIVLPLLLGLVQQAPLPMAPVRPCAKLCAEAIELIHGGKVGDGLTKLEEAAKADPHDPEPHNITAQVFQQLAKSATPYAADYYREKAGDEAELAWAAKSAVRDDQIRAQILLESIHQDEFPREASSIPEAREAFNEGERLFNEQKFEKAREFYKKALERDPNFAVAALYVGDCYHAESKAPDSATWFRKATEIRPDYPKAWRYLADGLIALGKPEEAEIALLGGIAAHPGNRLTWVNLGTLRAGRGKPMTKLEFRTPVTPFWDAEGKQTIVVPEKPEDPESQAIWIPLVATVMDKITVEVKKDPNGKKDLPLPTRFDLELLTWHMALQGLDKSSRENKREPKDPILAQFLRFERDGQLEAALFLLRYKEAFRPDFEKWKKKNPKGIANFLDRYNLRP